MNRDVNAKVGTVVLMVVAGLFCAHVARWGPSAESAVYAFLALVCWTIGVYGAIAAAERRVIESVEDVRRDIHVRLAALEAKLLQRASPQPDEPEEGG